MSKKVLLYAIHAGDLAGLKCCTMLLKMKQLNSFHIHVTTTSYDEDFLSDMVVIQELDRRFFLHQTDVMCDESVKDTINGIIEAEGKIDYLVCDMNQRCYQSAAKNTPSFLTSLYETNFYPYVRVISNVIPHMKGENCGKIIILNSYAGFQGLSYASAYCSTRFALNGFIQSVAAEVAVNKISISTLQTVIRKPENASAHDGVCFNNHQGLSDLDREFIHRINNNLERNKLYKWVPAEKIGQAVKSVLLNLTDSNVYMNKSCKQRAVGKFVDPKGVKTLSEISKFFLNVELEDFIPYIIEQKISAGSKVGTKLGSLKEKKKTFTKGFKKNAPINPS